MITATERKNAGKLEDARKRFLAVAKTYQDKGKTKAFQSYWRAQAEAADCLYQVYLGALKEDPQKADPANRDKAIEELKKIAAAARKDG